MQGSAGGAEAPYRVDPCQLYILELVQVICEQMPINGHLGSRLGCCRP